MFHDFLVNLMLLNWEIDKTYAYLNNHTRKIEKVLYDKWFAKKWMKEIKRIS